MVAIVTCRAPLTAKTTYVICKMDHALPVCQDGPECIVKQVRIQHGNMLITVNFFKRFFQSLYIMRTRT